MKTLSHMQYRPALWLCAAAIGFSTLNLSSAIQAQPGGDAPKGKLGKARKNAVPKKVREALETKLGKPLTPEQMTQIAEASKARAEAQKAAREKYEADLAKATGLTVEDIHAIVGAGRPGAKAAQ